MFDIDFARFAKEFSKDIVFLQPEARSRQVGHTAYTNKLLGGDKRLAADRAEAGKEKGKELAQHEAKIALMRIFAAAISQFLNVNIDKRILQFLKKHHVCSVATCSDGQPWCATVFYVLMEEEGALVFTSDPTTRHIKEGLLNQKVAGTIALETEIIGLIRGVQFSGIMLETPEPKLKKKALRAYFKRFPYAVLNHSPLWICALVELKFTDNRLGFGKKLRWSRD